MPSVIRGTDTFDSAVKYYGFKNHIINGNFDIWQRGTSQTSDGYGSDDRWRNDNVGSTKTHSQVSCTDTERALFNANYFSRTVVTSVAGSSNGVEKYTRIEDVTKLAGKTVTLSFWAKSDSTKNIGITFWQVFGTGGNPSTSVNFGQQIVQLTSTWQKKTITLSIPSIVGKTIGTNGVNTTFTQIGFGFDSGSLFAAAGYPSLGQQSGTFDIAQVQLEEGSAATPFEQRPYGLELSLCQRYYEEIDGSAIYYTSGGSGNGIRNYFKVEKRAAPTITVTPLQTSNTPVSTWSVFTGFVQSASYASAAGVVIHRATIKASAEL